AVAALSTSCIAADTVSEKARRNMSWCFTIIRVTDRVNDRWESLGIMTLSPWKRPDDVVSQWGSSLLPLISGLLLATFQALVSAFTAGSESPTGRYRQHVDDLDEYIADKELSEELSAKIRDYFIFKYRGKIFSHDGLLALMSDRLQEEIQLHNWREMLAKVPFLQRFGDKNEEMLLAQVAGAMRECFFLDGDTIFGQGEHGDCMYFIISGEVSVFVDQKK
ncbi:anaphase-promoting complex subunit Hcn1, partial [Dinochytrium kinnereticum]